MVFHLLCKIYSIKQALCNSKCNHSDLGEAADETRVPLGLQRDFKKIKWITCAGARSQPEVSLVLEGNLLN